MVGNAPVKDHNWIEIEKIELGYLDNSDQFVAYPDAAIALDDAHEFFARAQCESLSNSQKLSAPSFEKMVAGAAASSSAIQTDGSLEAKVLEFESILLPKDPIELSDNGDTSPPSRRWKESKRGTMVFEREGEALCAGAGRARQWAAGASVASRPPAIDRRVQVAEEGFQIVNLDDLMPADGVAQPDGGSRSEADRIIASLDPAKRVSVQVVPSWEVGSN